MAARRHSLRRMLLLQSSLHNQSVALSVSSATSYFATLPFKIPTLSVGRSGGACFQGSPSRAPFPRSIVTVPWTLSAGPS
ncbi:hypothetical protein PIB30_013101 [Stylosanthes scabra]|uniref:Secreted protein n=1 Tax=Stylosanthes scabra TaxID=79078 RepID=A0ABU6V5J9_9FABA|nr:hypothetical protein [Stylosanthes scabra]